jgi:hypothetical protein
VPEPAETPDAAESCTGNPARNNTSNPVANIEKTPKGLEKHRFRHLPRSLARSPQTWREEFSTRLKGALGVKPSAVRFRGVTPRFFEDGLAGLKGRFLKT